MKKNPNRPRFRDLPGLRAFSLIEVTLALGVVSFAFVALLGALPVGLNTFTNSVDAATESQIAQSILTQARQAKFSELVNFSNSDKFYFDEQGSQLSDKAKQIYSGKVTISPYDKLEVGKEPKEGSDLANMNGAVVKIEITKISAPKTKKTLTAFLANNGL